MGKIYKDDAGTVIDLDAGEDISTATSLKIYYTKPSGATGFWTASLQGTSQLRYTTDSNDIDEAGVWTLQALVANLSGSWRGESVKVRVYDHFE